jgi:UDP-3-O-[3-hydroxymyristoyl] glucosamine N-acyltransferase
MDLKNIAALISGEIVGDAETQITGVAGITDAQHGDITYLVGTKLLQDLLRSKASAVIVKETIEGYEKPQVRVRNPRYAFAKLLFFFFPKKATFSGISDKAFIAENAVLRDNVIVYPFAYIAEGAEIGPHTVIFPGVHIGEGSIIGEGCTLYPNVVIREGVSIGNRVIIHPGAVIGSDGFGYVFEEGMHYKIPQIGRVVIEDDVEIGANVTIDRATTGVTVIGRGTKIDNLVHVAHNVRIGRNVLLVAQAAIAGSCDIGDGVIIAGQAGIADHASIEAGTVIRAQSGVRSGLLKQGEYMGSPILPLRDHLRSHAIFSQLPELKKRLYELERRIAALTGQSGGGT